MEFEIFNPDDFGWNQIISMLKITNLNGSQTIVDGYLQSTTNVPLIFQGIVQPLDATKLTVTLTEERDWEPLQVHTTTNLKLLANDRVIYLGKKYKIMATFQAYQPYGFYEYHLIRDYE